MLLHSSFLSEWNYSVPVNSKRKKWGKPRSHIRTTYIFLAVQVYWFITFRSRWNAIGVCRVKILLRHCLGCMHIVCFGLELSLSSQVLPPNGIVFELEHCCHHWEKENWAYRQKIHWSSSHPEPTLPPFPHHSIHPNRFKVGGALPNKCPWD